MKTRATKLISVTGLICATTALAVMSGCKNTERQAALHTRLTVNRVSTVSVVVPPAPLPLEARPRPDLVVASLNKRILGRKSSQRDIYRVINDVDPIVKAAAQQPSVQDDLKRLADIMGLSVDKMRTSWIAMQDADIMLESGGDPDVVSTAGAVGVAQWMPAAGASAGLSINQQQAEQLSPQITELQRQIAWVQYLRQRDYDRAAPGIPIIAPTEVEPTFKMLLAQLGDLRSKRAALDERYDARKAIFAQTRYLLGISRKYPSPSWVFQAYHGGEGGVTRELREYCGARWPGSAYAAIRDCGEGTAGHRDLTFEDVYFGSSPSNHPESFRYLYGRGDDHRHYWWKLRAAQEALDLYARNTAESARVCKGFYPGSPAPTVWYGKTHPSLLTLDDLNAAHGNRDLVLVSPTRDLELVNTVDDPINAKAYDVLRPSAAGALELIMTAYRKCGGASQIRILDLTRTLDLNLRRDRRLAASRPPIAAVDKPKWPPPEDPITDQFDYHISGIEFDIERPMNENDRMIMDYCIGYFEDRGIVMRIESKEENAWQIVPNPKYANALDDISQKGKLPVIAGL